MTEFTSVFDGERDVLDRAIFEHKEAHLEDGRATQRARKAGERAEAVLAIISGSKKASRRELRAEIESLVSHHNAAGNCLAARSQADGALCLALNAFALRAGQVQLNS